MEVGLRCVSVAIARPCIPLARGEHVRKTHKKLSVGWWLERRPSLMARLAERADPGFRAPLSWHRNAAEILASRPALAEQLTRRVSR